MLRCHQDDVPVLVAAKLLKPLGNPVQNSTKFFATKKILELAKDEKWLHRMTLVLSQHWRERNARKKAHTQTGSALMPAAADG